jgi:glycosyltransferase involved in cell wall biosynthesis
MQGKLRNRRKRYPYFAITFILHKKGPRRMSLSRLPLVTVITPSFNQAAYLEAAMRSVLSQDYPNIEYMVVDGGSTDGSVEILRKYEGRLAWWTSGPDAGQSDAINKGLARASGEVVAWLNSDDLYFPGAVGKAVAALEANPGAGMVYSDIYGVDARGERTDTQRYGQYGLLDLLCMRTIAQPTVFMRASVFARAGAWVDPSHHMLMDHQLWIRMAKEAPLCHVKDIWAAARRHPEAKNSRCREEFPKEARRFVETFSRDPGLGRLMAANRRKIEAGQRVFESVYVLAAGDGKKALAGLLAAALLDPLGVPRFWRVLALAGAKASGSARAVDALCRLRGRRNPWEAGGKGMRRKTSAR